jgi:hypothetical protein
VLLMTQDGGMPAHVQGDGEGVKALPLNWVECGKNQQLARLNFPVFGDLRQNLELIYRPHALATSAWTPRQSSESWAACHKS